MFVAIIQVVLAIIGVCCAVLACLWVYWQAMESRATAKKLQEEAFFYTCLGSHICFMTETEAKK